ncbi:hypothetical protein Ndes2437B_g07818 [Nannochloris sp. 'desiccata']
MDRYHFNHVPRNTRTCRLCNTEAVEDEQHMVFECTHTALVQIRQDYQHLFQAGDLTVTTLPALLKQPQSQLAGFITACFTAGDYKERNQIFESVRPQSTREVLNTVAHELARIQNLNPSTIQNSLFPDIVAYDKTKAAQQCLQATEEAIAAGAGGSAADDIDVVGFDGGAPAQQHKRPRDGIINPENTSGEQEEGDSLCLREEELNNHDLEALLSPIRSHPAAAVAPAPGFNARAAASPTVLEAEPTSTYIEGVPKARRALLNDEIDVAAPPAVAAETAAAAGMPATAKPASMSDGKSSIQEEDASAYIGAMTAEELLQRLKAVEAENAILKSKQSGGRGGGNANGATMQATSKASLLHGLECMVNKNHLESIDSELGNVHPHQQANFAIQKLAATGGLSYNNAVANISARNIGSGVPLSPGRAMVPNPLQHIPLPSQQYGSFNAAAERAVLPSVIAVAAAAAATAVAQAFGCGAQYSLPSNAVIYPNVDANMVDAARGAEMPPSFDLYASAGPRSRSAQATVVDAGKGSLPTSKKKTKSRYMELQPIGRDLPKWQDFVKSIDALINWCFEPRFEVDGRELSVVELELEPATGQKDTSWRGPKLRQRESELNSFWQLAKEQLPSKAAATSKADMYVAAEQLRKKLGVETVAALMRVSSAKIAERNAAGKGAANVASN